MAEKKAQSRHKIRQAVFDLKYSDEKSALDGREPAAKLFENTVLPALDEIFDIYMPNGRVYRLDELKIDLGKVNLEKPDLASLQSAIRTQVMAQLGSTPEKVRAKSTSPEQAFTETLVAFIRTGLWSWDAPFGNASALEAAVLKGSELDEDVIALSLRSILPPPLANDAVRQRIAYQFSPEFIIWLVSAIIPDQADHLIAEQENLDGEQSRMALLSAVGQLMDDKLSAESLLQADDEAIDQTLSQTNEGIHVQHAGIVLLHPFLESFFDQLALLEARDQTGRRLFRSPAAQVRAVHMLHYLAVGKEHPDEPLTALFKVLTGLPIWQPLPKKLSLQAKEKQECERLLAAVINHWKKLGRTSPNGLREGFLQREGSLIRQADSWKLTVEQRSIDVLIDFIPWGISVVRLPWIAEPIWVDWA
jgi:hypothetical protein